MHTNDTTTERTQPTGANDQQRGDEEQFWADWWREYAQTWN
ncbi:hypothetical protein [Kallotenue papyrolyticum]|nr:hypothetical protein [Kallotenue papyrolyticum]